MSGWASAAFLAWLCAAPSAVAAPGGNAGDAECGSCHADKTRPYAPSGMANALETIAGCRILRDHPKLRFQEDEYSYEIARDGDKSVYRVSDGDKTLTVQLLWAFGLGSAGQTYVFERDGQWYESRVSYFNAVQGLDLTLGAQNIHPKNLNEAAGRPMDRTSARECFDCHSTGAVHGNKLEVSALIPGVQCESCHGPAAQHAQAMKAGDVKGAAMKKLSAMSTEEMSDFCGRCHRTWAQIAAGGPQGIPNVRFQPYRLTNSRCYSATDPRIRCVACHDPHRDVVRDAAYYDAKCLACHGRAAAKPLKACPVAKKDCVTCHMPKIELPGAHNLFSDHQIRIAREHERYPN